MTYLITTSHDWGEGLCISNQDLIRKDIILIHLNLNQLFEQQLLVLFLGLTNWMTMSRSVRHFANSVQIHYVTFITKSLRDMVSCKWLNMNNSTKRSSITSILISLSSLNLRKCVHQNKPSYSKKENPMRHSSSQDDNNRRKEQDLLVNILHLQVSPSKNFG